MAGCCCLRQGTCLHRSHTSGSWPATSPPFPPLYCPSPHIHSNIFTTVLQTSSLHSFPEGLSGRSVAYQTHFSFKTALNHCPGPKLRQRPLFITSCPSLSPLRSLVWKQWQRPDSAQGLSLSNHITWFEKYKLDQSSFSRFRIENQLKRLKLLAVWIGLREAVRRVRGLNEH